MTAPPHLRVLSGGAEEAAEARDGIEETAPKRVYVPIEVLEEEPWYDRSLLVGLLLALIVNSALGWYVFRYQPEILEEVLAPVEFVLVEPPPPPEPEPEPEPEPPKPKPKPKVVEAQPKTPPPTMTDPAPPTDEPPPPPIFGVSLSSTAKGGAFKTRVGNTLMKEAEKEVTDPSEVKALPRVSFTRIEKAPRLISDYKAEYPPGPQEEGIEGTVTLSFTVDEEGKVRDVVVRRGVHPELDAAAKAAVQRFRYRPGTVGGEPVITTGVSHNYTWLIEE